MANTAIEQILATQPGSLVGFWKCDEASGNLADSIGAITLTATAFDVADYRSDGPAGYAIGPLNSANEYAIGTGSPLGTTIPNAFTLFAIVKYNSTAVAKAFLSVSSNADSSCVYIGDATTGDLVVRVRDAGTDIVNTTRDANMTNGSWYSVAVTCSGGNTLKLYLNGVQVGTDISFTLGTIDNIDRVVVGGVFMAGALFNCCDEAIQLATMWTTALSAAELLAIHDALRYHKVYPGGGEEWTALQTAVNAVDTSAGTHTFELGPGDFGALTTSATGVVFTFQPATGAQHTGKSVGTAGIAHTTGAMAFSAMDGALTMRGVYTSSTLSFTDMAADVTLDDMMYVHASGTVTNKLLWSLNVPATRIFTQRNSVFYVTGGVLTNVMKVESVAAALQSLDVTLHAHNNSAYVSGGTVTNGFVLFNSAAAGADSLITSDSKNNVVVGTGTADFVKQSAGAGGDEFYSITGTNNASEDLTASEWGTGSVESLVAANTFVSASDLTPKAGSALIDAGVTVAGFSDDIAGTARGATWDIGCFEFVASGDILPILDDTSSITPSQSSFDQNGTLLARYFAQTGLAVSATRVASNTIVLAGVMSGIVVEVVNAGANALDVFSAEVKPHPDGEWQQVENAADWATPDGDYLDGVTDAVPNTLAGGATTVLAMQAKGAYAMRFTAQAVAASTLNIRAVATP